MHITCADPEGGQGSGQAPPPPNEKSQKYRVSQQYWSGCLKNTKLQSKHSMVGKHRPASETPFKWRFAGRPMMARLLWNLDPPSPLQLNKQERCQSWTPSNKTFWIRAWIMRHFIWIFTKDPIRVFWYRKRQMLCY